MDSERTVSPGKWMEEVYKKMASHILRVFTNLAV